MSHLGDLCTVLADDETGTWADLPTDVRLRALAHVAGCSSCRADVDDQRRVKTRVRLAAGAPTLQAMPAGLLDSLLRLPASPQPSAALGRPAPPVTSAAGSRSMTRGRHVAAAGIAASVVVGLGAGGSVLAGSVGGVAASSPRGASPSASPTGTSAASGVSIGFTQTVPAGFGTASVSRPVSRPTAASALSVVYRRP
jgi:hypothetical protein